ncbi:hypothetical protein D3C81_2306070 [compost metagenome]
MVQNRILNSGNSTPSGLRKKKINSRVISKKTIGNSTARSWSMISCWAAMKIGMPAMKISSLNSGCAA